MKLSIGYMTFPTKAEAKEAVTALLENRLIACANLIDGVESYFWWEEDIQKVKEVVVIFKTRAKNEDKIIRFIRKYHSYECPCVVFSSLDYGNPEFLKWIDKTC